MMICKSAEISNFDGPRAHFEVESKMQPVKLGFSLPVETTSTCLKVTVFFQFVFVTDGARGKSGETFD